jgi:molecular chaperone GrpE
MKLFSRTRRRTPPTMTTTPDTSPIPTDAIGTADAHGASATSAHSSPSAPSAATGAAEAVPLSAETQLAELQAKHTEVADAYLRAKAEAENTRRRAEEDISKARKFAVEGFAESLLPVCDSLEAAIVIDKATPEQLLEGVHATLRQLTQALERNPLPRPQAPSLIRTSTKPLAWCRPNKTRARSWRCCKRAT